MRIGVVGAGNVGRTLGESLARAGHEVRVGVRDPDAPKHEAARAAGLSLVPVADALDGDVVVLAVPGAALEGLLLAHAATLAGRVVIDATNHVGGETMHQLPLFDRLAPDAVVFRAFTSIGWETFRDPVFGDQRADLMYVGPPGPGQQVVEGLITDVGLRPVRLGGHEAADVLDSAIRVWFTLARQYGRHVALKVLTDQPPAG